MYDYYIGLFGVREVAEQELHNLFTAVRQVGCMLFPLPFASVHRSSRVCWTCCTQCSVRSSPPPGPGLLAAVWPADDPDAVHAERVCECTVPSVYPHVYRKAKTCHCFLSTQTVSMLCVLCLPALPADSSTSRPTWESRISLPFSLDVAADTLAPWRLAWMVCPMVAAIRHPALAHTHTPREITAGSTKYVKAGWPVRTVG